MIKVSRIKYFISSDCRINISHSKWTCLYADEEKVKKIENLSNFEISSNRIFFVFYPRPHAGT